jgi:two-component system phosphate regulon sensor histidine kinase PhoR
MPETPVLLEADQDAVRQALLNLVDNAIKYSEGRREVTIRLVPGRENVEIQVEDRGIGIEPEDREKIFEAFFRSPRAARHNPKGVGLGLKIVKHIMDAHGGSIGLRSEPGHGTTFSLIFPLRRPS